MDSDKLIGILKNEVRENEEKNALTSFISKSF